MTNKEYLTYLHEQKRLFNEVQSRYPIDNTSPYYSLQQARNQIYNDYMDRQIESQEMKVIEEMVQNQLKNMSIDVSLNGQQISDSIAKEITKSLRR